MNSVERIQYYSQKLEIEEPLLIDDEHDHNQPPLSITDNNNKTPATPTTPEAANTSKIGPKGEEGTKMLPPAVALIRIANAMPPSTWPTAGQLEFQGKT